MNAIIEESKMNWNLWGWEHDKYNKRFIGIT